jgi:hypothetical protein
MSIVAAALPIGSLIGFECGYGVRAWISRRFSRFCPPVTAGQVMGWPRRLVASNPPRQPS